MPDYDFDPDLAAAVPLLGRMPLDTAEDVRAARALEAELFVPAAAAVDTGGLVVTDRTVSGPDGTAVPVRVYQPAGTAAGPSHPGLLVIHGGGFVLGSVHVVHADATRLARELGAVVVSVGYRLAPEHRYPAALDDCYAALVWLAGAATELGVDPGRIGVLGRSAGAGLAAAVALLARDRNGPRLRCQHLCVPALDDRLQTPSMQRFTDTPTWDRAAAAASWAHYLGPDRTDVPIYAAPARATDLRGLPPAYISTMAYDPLRDEGIRYATALLDAGVSVELHAFPGTFHASGLIASAAVSQRATAEEIVTLRQRLA